MKPTNPAQMTYRSMPNQTEQLSILGYGCMRFPTKGPAIDEARTEAQIRAAIAHGVNYFDTAYLYPNSEKVLGRILAQGLREQVYIATKLPLFAIKSEADLDKVFTGQLASLQTGYIDYYLMHNISNFEDWQRVKDLGGLDFIRREQENGRIRKIGFSFHGNLKTFKRLVDDYAWDFCQIQYNYLDEHYQAGREGLDYAAAKGLGVIVMEPLRGGLLGAKMPNEARRIFQRADAGRSPAAWALRWLWQHPAVQVVLSGMNEESHIVENCRAAVAAATEPAFSAAEQAAIAEVKAFFQRKIKVNCTACAYCLPCPQGVDIPTCFAWRNNRSLTGGVMPLAHYYLATAGAVNGRPSRVSLCQDCGACETHCPQHLPIRQHLKETAKALEKPYLKPVMRLALRYMQRI